VLGNRLGGNVELIAYLGRAELAPVGKNLHHSTPPRFCQDGEGVHDKVIKSALNKVLALVNPADQLEFFPMRTHSRECALR
jgi:hypothetical protein